MSNPSVAKQILAQLGGNQFVMMTGSSNFVYDDCSLTMKLTTNKARATHLNIKLNALDLYELRFWRCYPVSSPKEPEIVKEVLGIYFDQLQDTFEQVTGLYVTLYARG